jgi:hypothetical protein
MEAPTSPVTANITSDDLIMLQSQLLLPVHPQMGRHPHQSKFEVIQRRRRCPVCRRHFKVLQRGSERIELDRAREPTRSKVVVKQIIYLPMIQNDCLVTVPVELEEVAIDRHLNDNFDHFFPGIPVGGFCFTLSPIN